MNDKEQLSEAQPPSERAIIFAFVACFVSLALFYSIARHIIEPLEIGWAKFLIYAIAPASVTFIFLHHSRWHPEIMGVKRTCSLLLITCAILIIAFLVFEFVLCMAQALIPTFISGQGPG